MVGKFIVFEGIDGSGLSTQSKILKDFLVSLGKDVVLTKEPQTNSRIGELIKRILRKELSVSPLTLQFLFCADRAHHLTTEVEPEMEKGKTVISDRYFFSTIAFGSLGIDKEFLKILSSKFRIPDLTFILDVPPEVCLERIKKSRDSTELFEDLKKSKKIRQNFLELKDEFPNIFVIDGNRKIEDVAKEIQKIVVSKI